MHLHFSSGAICKLVSVYFVFNSDELNFLGSYHLLLHSVSLGILNEYVSFSVQHSILFTVCVSFRNFVGVTLTGLYSDILWNIEIFQTSI